MDIAICAAGTKLLFDRLICHSLHSRFLHVGSAPLLSSSLRGSPSRTAFLQNPELLGLSLNKGQDCPSPVLFLMYGISPGSVLSMIGHSTSTSISVLYIVTSFGSGVGNGLTKFSISVTLCQEGSLTECLPRQKVICLDFKYKRIKLS